MIHAVFFGSALVSFAAVSEVVTRYAMTTQITAAKETRSALDEDELSASERCQF